MTLGCMTFDAGDRQMLTFHRVQVKNVWLSLTGLKIQARMAHNDETPV